MDKVEIKEEITIKVYIEHGYFSYNVSSIASAVEHAERIMSSGVYRSANPNTDELTVWKVLKVKVNGGGVGQTEYPDTFHRT